MKLQQAAAFVAEHSDDDDLDPADIDAAFRTIFCRDPDDEDREAGLWSLLVAACNDDSSCCEECGHPIDGSTGGAGDCNACHSRSQ
jgi:hypothetical protein